MIPSWALATEFPGPYFHRGDGTITLKRKQGGVVRATYRRDWQYDDIALQRINQVFGAPWTEPTERMSLRLIELLDQVQDHFGNAPIVLQSGYRSPAHNEHLRAIGTLAAQSSMHTEGGAIDGHLQGIASSQVFNYIKRLNCCGVGYYHGNEVHIDVGPARFWDETSSGTESREPQENAKIMLETDRDRYRMGEVATLRFMRITQYPIIVSDPLTLEWAPWKEGSEVTHWRSASITPAYYATPRPCVTPGCSGACMPFHNRAQAKGVHWTVQAPVGAHGVLRARLRARFCDRVSEKMPAEILSKEFEVW